MNGPNLQMPGSVMVIDQNGNMQPQYAALFASLAATAFAGSRSGTSTERPTFEMPGRYIGQPYYDSSLGFPIFLRTATRFSSSDVWVDATGTPV